MRRILHIDASYSGEKSVSRALSQIFITAWQKFHPEALILYRDLGRFPVPYINKNWIAAIHSPPETHTPEMIQALEVSNPLLEEFLSVDCYVFGIPMYGFTIPATLKAYLEHLIRIGCTYEVDEAGVRGLVHGKKALFITSRGGNYSSGSPFGEDHQEPYLRTIFGSFGIQDVEFVNVNNLVLGDREKSMVAAQARLQTLAAHW
ncbi:FMN-dependent NADH-azoreductase [Leptolyngbya sp. 7M]|uniref:FMN-dependent NADH-azoreductase n=1 Tax=Leptolyngbya sp. 7M TaxID=2812896 RepID=UPI001B8AE88F|nr:NAD(P)H-dependent oxidoreductase [Leptolyngbya sp. 7M]QYO67801.1 NAD(P)H-dependent oxidoreductase [Leptolyngbya sp. 7M]